MQEPSCGGELMRGRSRSQLLDISPMFYQRNQELREQEERVLKPNPAMQTGVLETGAQGCNNLYG